MELQYITIVIPVYQGELSLRKLIKEISVYFEKNKTQSGHEMIVSEVILVHDCGPDKSDVVINEISKCYKQVKPIWLTKNSGQHAATLAGMSSSSGDWIVTIDEDGQHDPLNISDLLDCALKEDLQVVYAQSENRPPHGLFRNLSSKLAKRTVSLLTGCDTIEHFNSYRLIRGDVARSLAAYCGHGVYLDVALLWIAGQIGRCQVRMRNEQGRPSGYNYKRLLTHFWNLVLTSGTRPLRFITLLGLFSVAIAFLLASYAAYEKIVGNIHVEGWASIVILVSFFSGCILISLGMIAEYLAISMGIAMGKPLYVISSRSSRLN